MHPIEHRRQICLEMCRLPAMDEKPEADMGTYSGMSDHLLPDVGSVLRLRQDEEINDRTTWLTLGVLRLTEVADAAGNRDRADLRKSLMELGATVVQWIDDLDSRPPGAGVRA